MPADLHPLIGVVLGLLLAYTWLVVLLCTYAPGRVEDLGLR